jgi:MFS transporter, PPP family, 3-phenylpropionic acid transporter
MLGQLKQAIPLPARLAAFYFAFFAYTAAYVAYFPLYLSARGLGAAEIALVLALPQLARMFAPAAWGWLADRTGAQRGIVLLSCAAMVACFVAMPHAGSTSSIALLIAVTGFFSAGALPLVEAITLGSGGAARYGPIRLWGSVGFIAVVLAGGIWLDVQPVDALPHVLTVLAFATLGVAAGLPHGKAHPNHGGWRLIVPPGAYALMGAGFCMAAAHGALYAFFTVHLEQAGYAGSVIGMLWTIGVVAEILVFAFLPALFRRWTLSTVLAVSLVCASIRFLAIGWGAGQLWLLCIAQLLHAATFGSFHAASVASVQRLYSEAAHARGQGLFSSVSYGAGGAAGILLSGWAWQLAGPGSAFSVAALFGLVGANFAYALRRNGL